MSSNGIGTGIAMSEASKSSVDIKNIFDLVSHLTTISLGDRQKKEQPAEYFTINSAIKSYTIGYNSVFSILLSTVILIPLCIGIWLGQISILGQAPILYDKVYFTFVVLFMSSCMFMFQIWSAKYCVGTLTLLMFRNMYAGSMTAIFAVGIIITIIFSLLSHFTQSFYAVTYYGWLANIGTSREMSRVIVDKVLSFHNIFDYSIVVMWIYFILIFIVMLSVFIYKSKKIGVTLQDLRDFINNARKD